MRSLFRSAHLLWLGVLLAVLTPLRQADAGQPARYLAKEDITLYGIGLKVEPAQQTVPKDIATIVSTYLKARTEVTGLPPFAPDAEVRATLAGPSFGSPRELVVRPNTPFQIPALSVPGVHTLENIRLVSNGEVLLYGAPQSVRIEVIERLLVTQVTARPLTAAEIREKGIVYNKDSFQAYNFSAAFAIEDRKINLNFSVLLPSLQSAADQQNPQQTLQTISGAQLPTLKTIIPDTLRIQTQVPNLSVVGFTLKAPALQGQNLVVPPIPGVVVIPGDIGFLNQFFSVMLLVGNVAPAGSNLVVSELKAEIVLPPDANGVTGSGKDPLVMARTANGVTPKIAMVVQPGFDAKLGTADDIPTIGPGETGNAEYLVEGRREGTHVVEMQISGILNGLPVGPVPINGRAAGSVLVRNPKFALTFTHPEVVSAGEPYTLDVTVSNTSTSPANLVTLNLYPRNVSGATISGEAARQIESIAPGDSATVSFSLISRITGKVTAATLDSDENVAGRFALKTTVGELGVPPSPDSLVLPKEASSLPAALRDATIGLLGKAWAVATAPPAALPRDLSPFSRKIVIDRAVETAEAGLRVTLGEPLADSAAQLAMDFMGSNYARLPSLVKPADLEFEQDNFEGFDELRRKSIRGDVFASAIANVLATKLASEGSATAFHDALAQHWSYRPGHVSVLAAGAGGALSPYELVIVDNDGRRVGGTVNGKIVKEIPFSDLLPFTAATGGIAAELAVLATPPAGALKIRLMPRAGVTPGTPAVLSIVLPDGANGLRHVVYQLDANEAPAPLTIPGAPNSFTFELAGATATTDPATNDLVVDPAPTVISVIQQADADQIRCDPEKPGFRAGRIVAVLFSEEVTPQSVQDKRLPHDITHYVVGGNAVVGVALQPGRRIAFLALRDPIGPFIPRSIAISDIADLRGHVMTPWTGPMTTTVNQDGAVVSGRVLDASGKPMPFADVRLFYLQDCGIEPRWAGISAKQADATGAYSWDYVAKPMLNRILAVDTATNEFRNVQYNVQRQGQHLNVDIVFLGRGSIQGTVRSEQGVPLFDTVVRVTSLTDQSQYSARSDANGRYAIARVPVGNIFIEAVNEAKKAQVAQADYIPSAGSVVQRDLTLLDVEQRKVTVKHGKILGHVYRADGVTPAGGLPIFAYYRTNSQEGVACPPGTSPCPIARATTAADGSFSFVDITAGELTLTSFDQTGLSMAQVGLILAPNATASANLLLSGGLGTVKGKVLTADGTPVDGAQVGGGLSLTTTNDEGEFTLNDVPVGRREIVAVSTALGATGKSTIDIVMPGDVVSTTIVFAAQGSVAGTVVQANGTTPVAGVTVYVFRRSPAGGGYEILGQAPTNAQGGYQIDRVPAGSYQVSAFSAGFTDGNVTPVVVKFNGQVARANIRFRGGAGTIIGTVFNDNGNTPLKARVGVSGDRVRVAGGLVGVGFERVENFAIADSNLENGQFSLSGILVGAFTLNAVGQFSPDPISVEGVIPSPGATVNVELRLKATSQIRGVVTNPNGTPVGAGVIVRYKSEEYKLICSADASGEEQCESIPQGIQSENTQTDTDGRFWLPVVNAGSFSINVEDENTHKVGLVKGSVRPGETAEVPVRLLAQGSVQVRVFGSDTTTPIPGATVVISQPGFPKIRREGTADPNGIAHFGGGDGLAEGEYVVEATGNGFTGRTSGRITVDGAEVVTNVYLFNATGTVHGIIYNADGFTPVANADVIVANTQGPLAFAVSGPDGGYSLDTIPLGDVHVEIFDAKTGRRGSGSGYLSADGQSVPINVVLSAVGVVKGIVLDAQTRLPLKGWTVTLAQKSASGVTLPVLTSTTGVDGRFLIPGAAKGTFVLHAVKTGENGTGQAGGALEQEGQVVDVPMLVTIARPLSGSITGTVLTAAGAPAANATVEVKAQSGLPVPAVTDQFGVFSIANVPLGRFTVRARAQGSHDAGSAIGEVRTDGEVAAVVVAMEGVAQVSGTVERADGSKVTDAEVVFEGFPGTACTGGTCTTGTDGQGHFSFIGQPARSFTITATESLTQLKGIAGGPLAAGENRVVRIVLAPTAALSGRVLRAAGQPASGIIAELIVRENTADEQRLYKQTQADGTFVFPSAPLVPYRLVLADPIGSGSASRSGQLTGALSLGDIVLDEAAPAVASLTPLPSATGVPVDQAITIVFTEPIQPGTINAENIKLQGPDGAAIDATRNVTTNDTTVVVKPLIDLTAETRYTLRVTGINDRVGKVMAADYTAAFTTVDVAAPQVADASPAANAGGVPIYTPIRIRFSEPIDPAKFPTTSPIVLTGPNGVVPGQLDYRFGNTVMIYTPNMPLAINTSYQVAIAAATDVAGNEQPSATNYQFSTTDTTKPQILELTPSNDGKVIENGFSTVTASVGATNDVAFIDFYVNGSLAFVDRASPFAITFQATPQLGAPGSTITVSAVATDTSGNRGDAISRGVLILADQVPAVTITSPAAISAANGAHIEVTVRATDDLGVKTMAFRAQTGNAADAATRAVTPASLDQTETFAFIVPANAAPGSVIAIEASAVDTFGHVATAAPVHVTVLDAVSPVVKITGATTGAKVQPGQQTTVVVTATDQGGVSEISFAASGVVTKAESRTVSPSQNSVVTSFTVTVPTTAQPGQELNLDATAKDRAGNSGVAARVILPVADTKPPVITLATEHGTPDAVPGESVKVIATATDETGVTRVNLSATGAVTFSDAKQVNPPLNSAVVPFDIPVPANATPGTTIQVQATATDNTEQTSTPAVLTLTVVSPVDVTLPASAIVDAGQTHDVTVQLGAPAPAEGISVAFSSSDTSVVTVPPSIAFASGETSKTLTLTGVAGGTAQVRAFVGGVERATMTVTVAGGIVSGIVRDSMLVPVVGADVTITSGATSFPAITDGNGAYSVSGVAGPHVSVRVLDPVTKLYGFARGEMAEAQGVVTVNVVLVPAGAISGHVVDAAGAGAGAGVKVDIFSGSSSAPIATTFTGDGGSFEFPLVSLGNYTLQATSGLNRGRASVSLAISGQQFETTIVYLGAGTVNGIVRAGGVAVGNARLKFESSSIFGANTPIVTNAEGDGTFSFPDVPIGSFTITAEDLPATQKGSASGEITLNGQSVTANVNLASYGAVEGFVRRSATDTTTVAGAVVTITAPNYRRQTTTDSEGKYRFDVVPLGAVSLTATDAGTRSTGSANVTIDTHQGTKNADIAFLPQGRLLVKVESASGAAVPSAFVRVNARIGTTQQEELTATTGQNGTVLIEHVFAGTYSVYANFGGLGGTVEGSLASNELKDVTVSLAPTGSITGKVYAPIGQAPVAGARVTVVGGATVLTNSSGVYRVDGLVPGRYDISVADSVRRVRAKTDVSSYSDDIVISTNGQVAERDFTMIGLGTVKGRVVFASNGQSASGKTVSLSIQAPGFQSVRSMSTNAGGFYEFAQVPVGPASAVVSDTTQKLYGERSGVLPHHDGELELDINLTSNAITLPKSIWDANNREFDVKAGGQVHTGSNAIFNGDGANNRGAFALDIVSGAATARFAGGEVPTAEDGAREFVVRQEDVFGLSVTRKIFVPRAGYFARYLEILRNPTESPITVDLKVTGHVTGTGVEIDGTSSGDAILDIADPASADTWFVAGRSDALGAAFVFDGAAAADRVDEATFTPMQTGQTVFARVVYRWNTITVPAGGTVALMHFGVQQLTRDAAAASAQRLAALPPEALAGLSAEEIAAIRNVAVPADGQSTIAALPALTGSVTGKTLEADGTTAIASASVKLHSDHPLFGGTYTATSVTNGNFSFTGVLNDNGTSVAIPVTSFTLNATYPGTLVASPVAAGTIDPQTKIGVRDVVFDNTGALFGNVTRHSGLAVAGGNVTIEGGTPSTTRTVSIADSTYRVGGLPPGQYTLTATITDPKGTGLKGITTAAVVAGPAERKDISIETTNTLTGVVKRSTTPVSGITVKVGRSGFLRETTTDTSGTYTFANMPINTFTVSATEPGSGIATSATVTTTVSDEPTRRDLTLVITGRVKGVVKLGSQKQPGLSVVLRSAHPLAAKIWQATTDPGGEFIIESVPVGAFTASVNDTARQLYGEATDSIQTDGQEVPITINLASNNITLPQDRFDASNFRFDIRPGGQIGKGNDAFGVSINEGAAQLQLDNGNGQLVTFAGSVNGNHEDGGRELSTTQSNIAGIKVTRKVYVPADGYFARYLELLTNTSPSPVTMKVRVRSRVGAAGRTPFVGTTASGDTTFDVAPAAGGDNWLTLVHGDDVDPFEANTMPPVAFVFGGADAPMSASAGSYTTPNIGTLTYEWQNVNIPVNGTVALMHFVVQQTSRAGAQAAAERLAQLPPEALSGLSGTELAAIRNFHVPPAGENTLEPLPALTAVVQGHTRASDSTTIVPGATVKFKSANVLFGRTQTVTANTSGAFTFTGALTTNGTSVAIPVGPFTVSAAHPLTSAQGSATGDFETGQTTATQDVSFMGTGTISVLVTTGTTPLGGASLRLMPNWFQATADGDGRAAFTGLQSGSYTLVSQRDPVSPQSGYPIVVEMPVTATLNQTTPVTLAYPAMGQITGLLKLASGGGTVPNHHATVTNLATSFYRTVATNGAGRFLLTELPAGVYQLSSVHPTNHGVAEVQVVIVGGQTTEQDLTLPGNGSVTVSVFYARGGAAPGGLVTYRHGGTNGEYKSAGKTNASGQITIENVPVGAFEVRAHHPAGSAYYTAVTGALDNDNGAPSVPVTLPPLGMVHGTLRRAGGAAVPGFWVQIRRANDDEVVAGGNADASGNFRFNAVPVDQVLRLVTANQAYPRFRKYGPEFTLHADNEDREMDIWMPAVATVKVQVRRADGTAWPGLTIESKNDRTYFQFTGYTNASGDLDVVPIVEGAFTIRVRDSDNGVLIGERSGTITPDDDATTVPFPVTIDATIGSIGGQVVAADGVRTLSNVAVAVYDAENGKLLQLTTSAADGAYEFVDVLSGQQGLIVRAIAPNNPATIVDTPVVITTPGETVTLNVTLPVTVGTVSGIVRAAAGNVPLANVSVNVRDSGYPGGWISTTTNASGVYQFTDVVFGGGFTIVAAASGRSVEQTGVFTSQGQAVTIDFSLPLTVGSVIGTVYAGDGVTTLAAVAVQVRSASGEVLAGGTTSETGQFSFPAVYAPGPFAVRASGFDGLSGTSASGEFTQSGEGLTLDVVIPASVVRGRVTQAGGQGVQSLAVFLETSDRRVLLPHTTSSDGDYVVIGAPVGPIRVTAQDYDAGIHNVATSTVADVATPVVVDITLPGAGTVTGRVFDRNNATVASQWVKLRSASLGFEWEEQTNGQGVFTFAGIPEGAVWLTGMLYDEATEQRTYVAGTGTVVRNGSVTIDVTPVPTGTVGGQVRLANSTPVGGASVHIESFYNDTAFEASTTADPNGNFTFADVPSGLVYLTAWTDQNVLIGKANGTLAPAGNLTRPVNGGTAVHMDHMFTGSDGFRYEVTEAGELQTGGKADGTATNPFSWAGTLEVNGDYLCCSHTAAIGFGNRQITLGPMVSNGLAISRSVYVPEGGGFARFFDVLYNPTSIAQTVAVFVRTYPRSNARTHWAVTPASTGYRYAVSNESFNATPSQASLGYVMAGSGAVPVPVTAAEFIGEGASRFGYQYTVTVGPRQRVALMHFQLQRDPTDTAGAQYAAAALSALSDPNALAGLTAEEKAMIVNFVITP